MGARGVSPLEFASLNMIGAAVWAGLIATLGYQFGNALEWLLHDIKVIQEGILAGILIVGVAWSSFRRVRSRRKARHPLVRR
jgi:membrane protein DedA with SNARE-associated domain